MDRARNRKRLVEGREVVPIALAIEEREADDVVAVALVFVV